MKNRCLPLLIVVLSLDFGIDSSAQDLFLAPAFNVKTTTDVPYGAGTVRSPEVIEKSLYLDLLEPDGLEVPSLFPGMVFIHGGGFSIGDKSWFSFFPVVESLVRTGYVVVSIDYRKFYDDPPAIPNFDTTGLTSDRLALWDTYPPGFFTDEVADNGQSGEENTLQSHRAVAAAIEDASKAVAWLRDNADCLNVDPTRIAVGGFSAGAITSLFLGYDEAILNDSPVQAVWSLSGSLYGNETLIQGGDPSLFVMHGENDSIVPASWAVDLQERAEAVELPHASYILPGRGHNPRPSENSFDGKSLSGRLVEFLYDSLELEGLVGRAAFTTSMETAIVSQEIGFDAEASKAGNDHSITCYAWDFGDGEATTGKTAAHAYTAPGRYTIVLTATDDRGLWMTSKQTVTIGLGVEVTDPWRAHDIGVVTGSGGTRSDDGCLLVQGSPGNIRSRADKFHFVSQTRSGNFSMVARLARWENVPTSAKAGLMIRENLEADARHASVIVHRRTSTFRHDFVYRDNTAGSSRSGIHESYEASNLWLQVERRGDTILGYVSQDGVTWSEPDTIELPGLGDEVHVGVAAAGQPTDGPWSVATICDVSVSSVPDAPDFLRGDCDQDGNACSGVNDALELLSWLFLGRTEPACRAACDPDGNGELELADAVYGLNFCFKGTDAPVAPFPVCEPGKDTDIALGCDTSGCD